MSDVTIPSGGGDGSSVVSGDTGSGGSSSVPGGGPTTYNGGVGGEIFLVEGGNITDIADVANVLLNPAAFTAPNFTVGDSIVLSGVAAVSETYSGGEMTLYSPDGESLSFDVSGTGLNSVSDFNFDVDLTDGTTLIAVAACYCRGTLICGEAGDVPVEQLSIGDKVLTVSGELRPVKWIGRRSYGGRFIMGSKDIPPICVKAGALDEDVPKRDLWISPHHAMYLNGTLVEVRHLVNGVSIVQADSVDSVDYFHIELETHDVIIAEGAPSETFVDDDSRGIFHNAFEYAALYPQDFQQPARYCAPRLDEGFEFEKIRLAIARRAGLVPAADARVGALEGFIDHIGTDRITGWARNIDHPKAPVCLDIMADGELIGQILANHYRKDLAVAGIGSGQHGFEFKPPQDLVISTQNVEVRRSLDGAQLLLSRRAASG